MRGFLICPDCGRLLTEVVQGPHKKILLLPLYLALQSQVSSAETHDLFSKELKKFIPRPGMVEVYQEVISRLYKDQTKGERADLRSIKQELEQVNVRLVKARNLLIEDQLDAVDYRTIKAECEKKISELETRLFAANTVDTNIEALLRKALENLSRLDQLWEEATAEKKRLIIGSIFPEKLTFDGNRFQTTRLNEGESSPKNCSDLN